MLYINALELINVSIKNNLLDEIEGKIHIYRNGTSESEPGWYLEEKDIVAKELMNDKKGQKLIISLLKKRNVDFTPTDYSWLSSYNDNL